MGLRWEFSLFCWWVVDHLGQFLDLTSPLLETLRRGLVLLRWCLQIILVVWLWVRGVFFRFHERPLYVKKLESGVLADFSGFRIIDGLAALSAGYLRGGPPGGQVTKGHVT